MINFNRLEAQNQQTNSKLFQLKQCIMGLFWIWACLIRNSITHLGNVADLGNWSGLKGVLHLLPKLTFFVLYLKIINTFMKNNICILSKLFQKLKNDIEI